MLSAIQGKLEGWTSNLLSYGGRITLVKAVLSAMPLHYMQALKIPIGVMQHVDRIRRNFLWKGNEICRGINCLANWKTVCTLKTSEGLGVIDLACQNDALLTKWIWTMETNRMGLWANTIRRLYGITAAEQLRVPSQDASFFIKDLAILVPFYSILVDRTSSEISWRWAATGKFSCATAYTTMHDRGLRSPTQRRLWKIKVPMKVRIFFWLMLEDKILTQEVLGVRGCIMQSGCHLCESSLTEPRDHLMWECPYARRFWRGLGAHHNMVIGSERGILQAWIQGHCNMTRRQRTHWDVIWAAGVWALWRERNRRLFSNKRKLVHSLIDDTAMKIIL